MKERLIFLTNDDGYSSKGMQSLIRIARQFGRVVVIAPEVAQSGMSHAFTMYSPLFLRKVQDADGVTVYALSGTPVDCVKVAFDHLLLGQQVDLVLSGVNHGSNAAVALLYSGTMGAAIEGSFYGCPSIGLSLTDHDLDADFTAAELWGERIVRRVLEQSSQKSLCLNVNIPAGTPESIRGIRVCRQARGLWRERFICRKDPRDRDYLWLTGDFINSEPDAEDTDEWALAHGYISVQPVHDGQTHYTQMEQVKRWFDTSLW
jgi:5'-nucleotidase